MNSRMAALLVACIAVMAVAGCMSIPVSESVYSRSSQDVAYANDGYSGGIYEEKAMSAGSIPAPMAAPAPGSTSPDYTSEMTDSGAGALDQKIILTAYLTIEVKDVTAAAESLKGLAAGKGGYISSSNIQKSYNDRLSGTVVLRVPAAEFESTLASVKAIGTVKSVSTQGQDVTEEYVDLQAQKTSYTNQLAQYNEIMKKATEVEDVIKVQQQIDRVQTELNRLEGRLRYLNNRIDLSTITVNLQEPEPVGGDTGHNFVTTINEGIAGFFGMIDVIIILFFTLLPLIILGGIVYGLYRWKKGKAAPAAAEPSEPAGKKPE